MLNRSSRVRSIALCLIAVPALKRARVFKFPVARHLTMILGFQMTWPVLDRISYARAHVRSIVDL